MRERDVRERGRESVDRANGSRQGYEKSRGSVLGRQRERERPKGHLTEGALEKKREGW